MCFPWTAFHGSGPWPATESSPFSESRVTRPKPNFAELDAGSGPRCSAISDANDNVLYHSHPSWQAETSLELWFENGHSPPWAARRFSGDFFPRPRSGIPGDGAVEIMAEKISYADGQRDDDPRLTRSVARRNHNRLVAIQPGLNRKCDLCNALCSSRHTSVRERRDHPTV